MSLYFYIHNSFFQPAPRTGSPSPLGGLAPLRSFTRYVPSYPVTCCRVTCVGTRSRSLVHACVNHFNFNIIGLANIT